MEVKMQRTKVYQLYPTKEQEKVLKEMLILSSCVFNMANYRFRQAFFKKGKIPSFHKQQQAIQEIDEYQELGRSYALPMLQKHSELVSAHFKLLKAKKERKIPKEQEIGLPKYYKNRKTNTTLPSYLTIDNSQYFLSSKEIRIPLGHKMRKKTGIKHFKIKYNGIPKWAGKQGRGEIHYNKATKNWYFHQSIELETPKPKAKGKTISIDLGVKRSVVAYADNKAVIYSDKLFAGFEKDLRQIARLQQIAKGRNHRYTTRRIQRKFLKTYRRIDNKFKNICQDLLRQFNIKTIIIGDLTGILNKANGNKKANRMTHNYWSFGKLTKRIENVCEANGIDLVKISEAYTTQKCPVCGTLNKPKDRDYTCRKCAYEQDRDVVGAIGIAQKQGLRVETDPLVVEVLL